MPLKIESGTYTVNPVPKKSTSKFLLWKHWRRSVHEDRGEEKGSQKWRDRESRSGIGEVLPGLEEFGDSCVATPVTSSSSLAGTGLILTSSARRRTRPLSLAVQPLNYHRLDPDAAVVITVAAIGDDQLDRQHHRTSNMTSQESIGSCSLDVDRSVSDRSENTIDSVSERTLHSLNLSCNGEQPVSSSANLVNGSSETLQKSYLTPDDKVIVSNGHRSSPEAEQLTAKKPSYLGLACSISGYSGITRYDSKLREGFRSRDSSPGTRLITRDTSPAGFKSNENLSVPLHHYPPKSQSISPLAMDRQNGFANGMKEECKIETYRETRNSMSICQGFSEVDKGVSLHTTFPDLSPIRVHSPARRSPGIVQVMSCGQQNKSFSPNYESSPKPSTLNISNTSFSDTSILNGSSVEMEHQTLNTSSSSEKSFIQQRVERLYGPGALAQDNVNTEESLKNLPVLRHLRPEFRAQLPVVSSRKPTDGSEQIIKPLRRISPAPRKNEQQSKVCNKTSHMSESATESTPQHNSTIASIPDQQPAAPEVVLPVLETSNSSSNVPKQVQEAEKTEEKDGHYFLKLLKQETDKLLLLAASAEAELASGDPVALPEEAAGKLRSAAGKARLLASQKMQQFEGLCQKNINQIPGEEFPTTNEDLAGFWDMVMLQVVQVNELFDQIEKSRKSQWQEVCPINLQSKPPHPLKIRRARKKSVPATKCPVEKKQIDSVPIDTKKCASKELKHSKACHFLHKPEKSVSSIVTDSTGTNINLELYVSTYDEVCDVKKNTAKEKLTRQNIIIVERCIPEYTNHARFFNNDFKPFYADDTKDCAYSPFFKKDVQMEDAKFNVKKATEDITEKEVPESNFKSQEIQEDGTSDQICASRGVDSVKNNNVDFPEQKSSYSVLKNTSKSLSPVREHTKPEMNAKEHLKSSSKSRSYSTRMRQFENNISKNNVDEKTSIKLLPTMKEDHFQNVMPELEFTSRPSISSSLKKQYSKKSQYNVTFSDEIKADKIKKPLFDDRTTLDSSIIYAESVGNLNNYDKSDLDVFDEIEIKSHSQELDFQEPEDDTISQGNTVSLDKNEISNNTVSTTSIPDDTDESKVNSYKELNNTRTSRGFVEKPKGIRKSVQKSLQNDSSLKMIVSTMFKKQYNVIKPTLDNEKELTPSDETAAKCNKVSVNPSASSQLKCYKCSSTIRNKKIEPTAAVGSDSKRVSESTKSITDSLESTKKTSSKFVNKTKGVAQTTKIEISSSRNLKSRVAHPSKKFSIVTDIWSNSERISRPNVRIPTKQHQPCKSLKKEQPSKITKKDENIDQERKNIKPRQKSPHAIVWSQSDSQPFIPLSQETLNQLGRFYRIGKHPIFAKPLKESSNKLVKVKRYDQRRKESLKRYLNTKYPKKLLSNDAIINDCQDNSRLDIGKPEKLENDGEISTEVELVSSNYLSPCYANGDDTKTMYLLDMKKLSEKRKELQRFVSTIMTTLNKKYNVTQAEISNNKDTSSKLLLNKKPKRKYDIPVDNDIKVKISSQQDWKQEWQYNNLIYSHSVATFSLYASSDVVATKSLESLETGLALKACDPMNTSNVSLEKFYNKQNGEYRSRIEDIIESDKYFPLRRKGIEIYDVSNISCSDLSVKQTIMNDSNTVFVKIVPEKKSNASPSQNGNATKRRIPPVHKTKPTANSEANKKAREAREQARRQMIEERRRAMRSKMQNQDDSVKIFAPET
ncbi:hypothetical protein KPH14_007126 [Odynerus spinipes]|uniref:Disks large-associated protein 5 n=1 Tax=Odynerus spinipes TaxID=1348599 RepID=A0AAD9RSY7_9HYME|nr:hypothetical protein KPH14_007126 [Odynerus spinipes]